MAIRYVCSECKGSSLEVRVWTDANTHLVTDGCGGGADDWFCSSCGETTGHPDEVTGQKDISVGNFLDELAASNLFDFALQASGLPEDVRNRWTALEQRLNTLRG